jgi:hypothetical protein
LEKAFDRITGWSFDGQPLRFAAGLVFCHDSAPIRRIKDLARRLADEAKQANRKRNLAAYQVLESFDLVAEDFHSFRALRSPGSDARSLLVEGEKVGELGRAIRELTPVLPRSRLYRVVEALLPSAALPPGRDLAGFDLARELTALRNHAAGMGAQEAVKSLQRCCERPEAAWFHLAELWDYLPAEGG